MFKIEVKRLIDNEIFSRTKRETIDEVNAWIAKMEAITTTNGSNPWGWKECSKLVADCTEEELTRLISITPPVLDENAPEGEVIILEPAIAHIASSYEIIITDISDEVAQKQTNEEAKAFLNSSDYKVLRHIRQKALEIQTTMTEEEYLELEEQRQAAAQSIAE